MSIRNDIQLSFEIQYEHQEQFPLEVEWLQQVNQGNETLNNTFDSDMDPKEQIKLNRYLRRHEECMMELKSCEKSSPKAWRLTEKIAFLLFLLQRQKYNESTKDFIHQIRLQSLEQTQGIKDPFVQLFQFSQEFSSESLSSQKEVNAQRQMPTDDQIRGVIVKMMKIYDSNSTGYIEGDEKEHLLYDLKLQLRARRNYGTQQLAPILDQLDRFQTGRITPDELFMVMGKINPVNVSA